MSKSITDLPSDSSVISTDVLLVRDVTNNVDKQATVASIVKNTNMNNSVTSQANSGTAGGTMYYINLGGIKMLWGTSASLGSSTGGNGYTWTLPASFFTTIQSITTQVVTQVTVGGQIAPVDSFSTTTINVKVGTISGSGSQTHSIFVIGT